MKKNTDIEKQLEELNKSLSIPYSKSREEIWEAVNRDTIEKPVQQKPVRLLRRRLLRLAAMIVLIVGSGVVLRYYHYTVVSAPGEMSAFYLPDGSEITLAAGSEASYYPLWWSVSRIVTLKGEAFFKVQKGEKFSVRSARGITSVLGTSFDIYARSDNYRVVCYTGKVNVEARKSKKQIVLTPGEKAEIDLAGDITFSKENKTGRYIAWLDNQFVFTSAPIQFVLDEISRRYDVSITSEKSLTGLYTGSFPASLPVEKALSIVCKPFGLTFVKNGPRRYTIK